MLNEDFTKDEQRELILTNIVEELVKLTVDSVIPTMDMCTCEICRLNACAIALNVLSSSLCNHNKRRDNGKNFDRKRGLPNTSAG